MKRMLRCFALVVVWLVLVPAAPAAAQPCVSCRTERCAEEPGVTKWCGEGTDPLARPASSPNPAGEQVVREKAKDLYETGVRNYNVGDYQKALDAFKAAYVTKPDPAFLFNIGQCHRMMKNPLEAIRAYRSYLREQPHPRHRAEVEALIGDLETAIVLKQMQAPPPEAGEAKTSSDAPPAETATGTLIVESTPPGASVRIDDRSAPPVGTTPHVQRDVKVGAHVVFLAKEGLEDLSKAVVVDANGTVRLDLTLSPIAPPAASELLRPSVTAPDPAKEKPRAKSKAWIAGVVIGAAAVLAAGLGLGLGLYYGQEPTTILPPVVAP